MSTLLHRYSIVSARHISGAYNQPRYQFKNMSRYAEAHKDPKGPGDARPTALQIVEDLGLFMKLKDKAFVVTGVSSGIGIETLRALYATGAHVFGTVRDMEKGQRVVEEVLMNPPEGGQITLIKMDLADLGSVKQGAQEILKRTLKIHGIINNAGVMATPEGVTLDGHETQFGTNHLGHFCLFEYLKDTLLESATPEFPARVVCVSSIGHRVGEIRFQDYKFHEPKSYNKWKAYGQSKTANIYFSNELEGRYGPRNLHSTSLHPGGISTALQVHVEEEMKPYADNPAVMNYMKSTAQGAATSVYALLSEEWKHTGGRYLTNCVEAGSFGGDSSVPGDDGYATWAYNETKAKQLWKDSLKFVGLENTFSG